MKKDSWIKSQTVQIILFVILAGLAIISVTRFDNTIKFIGFPFQIIPNTLGLTQGVHKNEVLEYKIIANEVIDVPIEHPGYYYVFTSLYYNWSYGPDIEIKSPQRNAVGLRNWRKISRFYDTIFANGVPSHRFLAKESGVYKFHFIPGKDTALKRKFKIGIVPDTITGRESIYRTAYTIQAIILIAICAIAFYYKVGKTANQRRKDKNVQGIKKRDRMDDFIKDNTGK